MKYLDLLLTTPEENLALDEALLDMAELGNGPGELLRLWEPTKPFVVIGRSSRIAQEVNLVACRELGVPVMRRCSGGAAVLAGPGCLMYAVILSFYQRPQLRAVEAAHCFVLTRMLRALNKIVPNVKMLGTSDLTLNERKFSGNSLRVKRDYMLYHGTILYDFPLEMIGKCLGVPPRQPEYRQGREHQAFVDNLPTTADQLKSQIRDSWPIDGPLYDWPKDHVQELVDVRYSREDWHARL